MTLHLFAIFISTLEPDYKRYWFCSKDLTLGHFDTCKVHVTKFNIKIVNKAYKKHPVSLLQSPGPGDDWLQRRTHDCRPGVRCCRRWKQGRTKIYFTVTISWNENHILSSHTKGNMLILSKIQINIGLWFVHKNT